jgi:hypothetical protein
VGTFPRTDSSLVLVWVTDRNDSSPGNADLYAAFFARALADRMRFVMSMSFVRTGFEFVNCFAADPPSDVGTRFNELNAFIFGFLDTVCSESYASSLFAIPGAGGMMQGFFVLTAVPKSGTITVTLRDANGTETMAQGWRYEPSARAIIFDFQPPPLGSQVIVEYEVACE